MSCAVLCFPSAARTEQYRTYVVPRPGETLQHNCEYQLTLPDASHATDGVFVFFERGWQFGNLYFDPDVTQFAEKHHLALLLAEQCRSKEREDIDVVPQHGIGRALVTALEQLAKDSHHPELARSKVILFSFSGGGSLVARMAGYIPGRIIAAVEYAPSQYDPLGMDTIDLPENALSVPQFIIANGGDKVSGTVRPYDYFTRYYRLGAPLTFMVQNGVPHCCVMNVKQIVLQWLSDVVRQRRPEAGDIPLVKIDKGHGWFGFIRIQNTSAEDGWHEPVWNVVDEWIGSPAYTPPSGARPAGWLPSRRFADAWRVFESEREHLITPLE
jgi:dienelactone hydrolase